MSPTTLAARTARAPPPLPSHGLPRLDASKSRTTLTVPSHFGHRSQASSAVAQGGLARMLHTTSFGWVG
eukprot:8902356-Alexandrium_andersonii.AAC.1